MSKKTKINIEKEILSKIRKGEIKMKPKWYFVLGSTVMFASLVGISLLIVFLINLSLFLIRRHGMHFPSARIEYILTSFPWWIPIFAIVGIIVGVWLLNKYDFSYKNNTYLIIVAFIFSLILGGFLMDSLGINEMLSRGKMGRFYQQIEGKNLPNHNRVRMRY